VTAHAYLVARDRGGNVIDARRIEWEEPAASVLVPLNLHFNFNPDKENLHDE
jgi:hypothetical protein